MCCNSSSDFLDTKLQPTVLASSMKRCQEVGKEEGGDVSTEFDRGTLRRYLGINVFASSASSGHSDPNCAISNLCKSGSFRRTLEPVSQRLQFSDVVPFNGMYCLLRLKPRKTRQIILSLLHHTNTSATFLYSEVYSVIGISSPASLRLFLRTASTRILASEVVNVSASLNSSPDHHVSTSNDFLRGEGIRGLHLV